jgi:hypothetical protein
MLEALQAADFEAQLGTAFRIEFVGHAPIELVLNEVVVYPDHSQSALRTPFSLMFHGPRELGLPQRIYPLQHADLGVLEIFIVPLGPDEHGMRYEAAFT